MRRKKVEQEKNGQHSFSEKGYNTSTDMILLLQKMTHL